MGKQYNPKDKAFHRAKQEGYLSRAVFKLIEIQKAQRILKPGQVILDLGSSPGSWSQYALEVLGPNGHVIGIDLDPATGLKATSNFHFIQGDIRLPERRTEVNALLKQLQREKLDLVLSDLSPKISGIVLKDHLDSLALGEIALNYARELLIPGGHLLIKLFPGEELEIFRKKMAIFFEGCRLLQLDASRRTSREIYLFGKSFNPDAG